MQLAAVQELLDTRALVCVRSIFLIFNECKLYFLQTLDKKPNKLHFPLPPWGTIFQLYTKPTQAPVTALPPPHHSPEAAASSDSTSADPVLQLSHIPLSGGMNGPIASLHQPGGTAPGVGGGRLAGGGVFLGGISCQREQHLRGGLTPRGSRQT